MSVVVTNSNLASLNAQRRFGESTTALSRSSERLSSGLRINRASDDAAGLAVASKLNLEARVYVQAMRNISDGISLLRIADEALGELSSITTRIKELAQQSANGVYAEAQRAPLAKEAQALSNEFHRIVETTNFNGLNPLNGSLSSLELQAGFGTAESVALDLGSLFTSLHPTGTFTAVATFASERIGNKAFLSDLNSDGNLDLITAHGSGINEIRVQLGNGDGSFQGPAIYTALRADDAVLEDFNGDGHADVIVSGSTNGPQLLLGNGDGTFQAAVAINALTAHSIEAADFNGDGRMDFATSTSSAGDVNIYLGNGNGTFQAPTTAVFGFAVPGITVGDINGDGKTDLVGYQNTDNFSIALGNGNGSFQAPQGYVSDDNFGDLVVGDTNGDGKDDVLYLKTGSGQIGVITMLGSSSGSLSGPILSYYSPTGESASAAPTLVDLTGDGILDLALKQMPALWVFAGEGDGSFAPPQTFPRLAMTSQGGSLAAGDINNDGVIDIVNPSGDSSDATGNIFLGIGIAAVSLPEINLSTQQAARAALQVTTTALESFAAARGGFGALEARLQVSLARLQGQVEEYRSAEEAIMSADMSEETANLVRTRILQQVGAAVLAQANQLPSLALQLLGV